MRFRYQVVKGTPIFDPDAKNYEGRKIMLYLCAFDEIPKDVIDPHFCDDGVHVSPFARFEPTENGWGVACAVAQCLP